MYLSLDPGAHPGWAIWNERFELTRCGIDKPPLDRYVVVLCERPTIYPNSKVPPADIITLAITAGRLVCPLADHGARVDWVEPRTWKGQVPKQIHHARIFGQLSPTEQSVVDVCLRGVNPKYREDAMDAIGLGQYAKRMHTFKT